MEPDHGQRAQSRGADDLLTLTQAAAFLDISKSTMYRLVDHGKVRSSKVGRQWRFRKEDLDKVPRAPDEVKNMDSLLALSAPTDPVLTQLWDNEKDAAYDQL